MDERQPVTGGSMDIVERITKFLDERAKVRGLYQEQIASLHIGDEREAMLLTSDLRAMLDELARLREELAMTQGQRNASNREIERLRDENAKLRAALEQIGDTACGEASHQYIALQALAAMREGK